jgi:hypothetical protein
LGGKGEGLREGEGRNEKDIGGEGDMIVNV